MWGTLDLFLCHRVAKFHQKKTIELSTHETLELELLGGWKDGWVWSIKIWASFGFGYEKGQKKKVSMHLGAVYIFSKYVK